MIKLNINYGNMILRSTKNKKIFAEIVFRREKPASFGDSFIKIARLEQAAQGFVLHVITTNLSDKDLKTYDKNMFANLIDVMILIAEKLTLGDNERLTLTDIQKKGACEIDARYSFLEDGEDLHERLD